MRSVGLIRTKLVLAQFACVAVLWLSVPLAYASNDAVDINVQTAFVFRDINIEEETKEGNQAIQSQVTKSAPQLNTWRISLSPALKSIAAGSMLRIPLPDGDALDVVISSSKLLENGDTQIIGEFADGGRALLTLNEKASFGSIISDDHNLVLSWDQTTGQILVDRAGLPDRNDTLSPDFMIPDGFDLQKRSTAIARPSAIQQQQINSGSKTRIDILIVYSSEFAGLFGSPQTRINQLIGFSNDAFDRSGILIQLNLVSAVELPFNNNRGEGAILSDATASRGDFSGLAALRNQVGADLVAVLPGSPGSFASGVAWISGDNPNTAFSVTRLSPGCCDSVFTHEIGHNLGSGHEHRSANPSQPSPCGSNFTGYSCGHGNSSAGWGTIMSYLNDRAIGYKFSNLDATCLGQPCGIAAGNPNAADNRTSFNISRSLVANFRSAVGTPPPDPPPPPPEPVPVTEPWLSIIINLVLDSD